MTKKKKKINMSLKISISSQTDEPWLIPRYSQRRQIGFPVNIWKSLDWAHWRERGITAKTETIKGPCLPVYSLWNLQVSQVIKWGNIFSTPTLHVNLPVSFSLHFYVLILISNKISHKQKCFFMKNVLIFHNVISSYAEVDVCKWLHCKNITSTQPGN